jgi:hypothetical protein
VWQPLHDDPRFKELMRRVEAGREQAQVTDGEQGRKPLKVALRLYPKSS